MEDVLRYLVIFALQSAAVYAVAASGLVVTYTTTGVFNFAHGAIGMIVAFSFWQMSSTSAWDLPVLPSFLVCVLVVAPALGWLLERVLMRRLSGASTLTTIVATDPMYVYFSVDERSLQRYMKARQADQPVRQQKVPFRFALDSDEGFPREGVLDFADNRVDADTGTIQMRGVVENKEGLLVSGSRVRVRLPVSKPYSAVVVPDTTILSDQNRRYVLVVDSQNIVSRRDVTLGRLLADSMQVILPDDSGVPAVSPDEWIIVQGLQRARINYEVERVEPDQKPLP